MNRATTIYILTIFLGSMIPTLMIGQDSSSLLAKMDQIMFGPVDRQGTVEIILKGKTGEEKIKEAEMFQKGTDRKLYRYTKPESSAGVATLMLPGGEMWLYMPALGKPKKISLLAKSQAFNGTDFSWEDMALTPYGERYTPKLIDSNVKSYFLELTPLDPKSDYSKIIVTLDKEYGYPVFMEYYDDNNGKKIKVATYLYHKIGKYWNAEEVEMTDLKKQHSTKIRLTNIKFDQGLTDDLFSVDSLMVEKKK